MTEKEFIEGVDVVESAVQGEMHEGFRVAVLWPCFRKEDANRWMRCCRQVAQTSFNIRTLVLRDFQSAMDRSDVVAGSYEDSLDRAKERMAARRAEKRKVEKSWKRTPREILQELAASGDEFCAEQLRLMDRRDAQKIKTVDPQLTMPFVGPSVD